MFQKRTATRAANAQRTSRVGLQMESLENRNLLACVAAGDANQDCFFDDSDFVLVMKSAKFETDQQASHAEGDWNNDGVFDTKDLIVAFQEGLYFRGAYDDSADVPINELAPLDATGDADTIVHYDSDTGDLSVGRTGNAMTTLQLRSTSGIFNHVDQRGLFDVSEMDALFTFNPSGFQLAVYQAILPTGLTNDAVRQELLIDGSILNIEGGLGNVQIGTADQLPDVEPLVSPPREVDPPEFQRGIREPGAGTRAPNVLIQQDGERLGGDTNEDFHFDAADFILAGKGGRFEQGPSATWIEGDWNGDGEYNSNDYVLAFKTGTYNAGAYDVKATAPANELAPFSTTGEADVVVHYTPETGHVAIEAFAGRFDTVHLTSAANNLTLMELPGLFDISETDSVFTLNPAGYNILEYVSLLPTGLTESALLQDLLIDGSMFGGGSLGNVQLNVISAQPLEPGAECSARVENGAILGDANLDGEFDSNDLVLIFQGGKYETDQTASWGEGDWTCDGYFESSDLVAAFKAIQPGIAKLASFDVLHDPLNDAASDGDRTEDVVDVNDFNERRSLRPQFEAPGQHRPIREVGRDVDHIRAVKAVDTVMDDFESLE